MTLTENNGAREAERAVGERSEAGAEPAAPEGVPDPEMSDSVPRGSTERVEEE